MTNEDNVGTKDLECSGTDSRDDDCDENGVEVFPISRQTNLDTANAERLMEDVIGCGPFQGLIILLVTILTKMPTAATFMFMAFGNYNPGWKCLDDGSSNSSISYNNTNASEPEYRVGTCEEFEACGRVQFNPDSSTIVTEWGLLCDRSWIASLIISLQMAGALVGSLIAGQLGDSFGRKTVVYSCVAISATLNLASMFSVSWQMFAVLRFFLGTSSASLLAIYYVLTNEFLPYKWRGPNNAFPVWNVGTLLFALLAYFFRDWKILHLTFAITGFLCFLPVFWVPESSRWLAVKKKNKSYIRVVKKMAKLNKKSLPSDETLNKIVSNSSGGEKSSRNYNLLHLLHPGYRKCTFIVSFVWFFASMIYYIISFGVKNLSGNFYLNLVLLFALDIPFSIFQSFVPNLIGRVKGGLLFFFFALSCIVTSIFLVVFGSTTHKVVSSIAILLAKVTVSNGWCVQIVHSAELYPTVVRGLAMAWVALMADVSAIVSPFLIPENGSTVYIYYIVMAVIILFICGGVVQLPETKGRPLKDNLEDE